MKTIRWGIIGCGDVTEVKSGPGFQKANRSRLVAVMRRNGQLAKDYALRHGVPKWYDDGEALINDPDVDAVYIATPPYAHKEYTLMSARAGKPVYVEKPMAMNFAECQEMIEACRAAGVPLLVAYYRRALDRFLKIKELVDERVIGEVRAVTITLYQKNPPLNPDKPEWRFDHEIGGGGKFVDLGCHMLDLLDYLLGPIRSVQGVAANQGGHYPAEDIVTARFEFESGVHGAGLWFFTSFGQLDQTDIIGAKGKISFSCFDDKPVTLITTSGITQFPIPYPDHVQQPLIQTVVDHIMETGSCPSTGETAARTNWVMDQILKSYYQPATLSS
jgi:predicted dehydrogenase